jgi:amino acid transporter
VTNAGAFFAYVGKGLGTNMGVGSAFVSIVGYLTIQLAVYGFFGAIVAGQIGALGLDLPWYVWSLIAWVLVTALSLLQVDVGAKVLGVLLILEVLALVIVAIAILANGGPEGWNIGASFAPDAVLAGGIAGGAGIAFAFAFASFIGFEATAIYGEESKDPKKTVRRATYWAIGILTVLFAVISFALVTGMGANGIFDQVAERSALDGVPLADPAAVLFSLASEYVGPWLPPVMSWLVISSLFAGLLALQNSASRYFFAMGRGGVLPRV